MAQWRNSQQTYGWLGWAFHWGMALLLLGLVISGYQAEHLPPSAEKGELLWWHKSFGLSALMLVLARLVWRGVSSPPALPESMSQWQSRLAGLSHCLLYFLMVVQPLSGMIMSRAAGHSSPFFGFWQVPPLSEPNQAVASVLHTVHEYGWWLLALLVALHASAALYHHFVLRDGILRRMLFPPTAGD